MPIFVVFIVFFLVGCGSASEQQAGSDVQMFGHYTRMAESKVKEMKSQILQASKDVSGVVSPELVAAVMFDEIQKRDWVDDRQDDVARQALQKNGDDRNRMMEQVPKNNGQELDTVSYGLAQFTPKTLQEIKDAGLLFRIFGGYQGGFWDNLRLATTDNMAPFLIAYRLRHIQQHWLDNSPEKGCKLNLATYENGSAILASLYSIGLTAQKGVNCSPEPNDRGRGIFNNLKKMRDLMQL